MPSNFPCGSGPGTKVDRGTKRSILLADLLQPFSVCQSQARPNSDIQDLAEDLHVSAPDTRIVWGQSRLNNLIPTTAEKHANASGKSLAESKLI